MDLFIGFSPHPPLLVHCTAPKSPLYKDATLAEAIRTLFGATANAAAPCPPFTETPRFMVGRMNMC